MKYSKGFIIASGYVNVTMGASAFAFDMIQQYRVLTEKLKDEQQKKKFGFFFL